MNPLLRHARPSPKRQAATYYTPDGHQSVGPASSTIRSSKPEKRSNQGRTGAGTSKQQAQTTNSSAGNASSSSIFQDGSAMETDKGNLHMLEQAIALSGGVGSQSNNHTGMGSSTRSNGQHNHMDSHFLSNSDYGDGSNNNNNQKDGISPHMQSSTFGHGPMNSSPQQFHSSAYNFAPPLPPLPTPVMQHHQQQQPLVHMAHHFYSDPSSLYYTMPSQPVTSRPPSNLHMQQSIPYQNQQQPSSFFFPPSSMDAPGLSQADQSQPNQTTSNMVNSGMPLPPMPMAPQQSALQNSVSANAAGAFTPGASSSSSSNPTRQAAGQQQQQQQPTDASSMLDKVELVGTIGPKRQGQSQAQQQPSDSPVPAASASGPGAASRMNGGSDGRETQNQLDNGASEVSKELEKVSFPFLIPRGDRVGRRGMFSLTSLMPSEQVEEIGPGPSLVHINEMSLLTVDPIQAGILSLQDAKTLFKLYMDEMSVMNSLLDPEVHTHGECSYTLSMLQVAPLRRHCSARLCPCQVQVPLHGHLERHIALSQLDDLRL